MKPNTNDEHSREQELEKENKYIIPAEEYLNEKFPKGKNKFRGQAMVLLALAKQEAIKQGYAKALDDVKKIIYDMKHNLLADNMTKEELCDSIKEQIAKLSHSQQEQKSELGKANSGLRLQSPADTHIPKEKSK